MKNSDYHILTFREGKQEYKLLIFKLFTYFAIPLSKERPSSFKNASSLYGVYKYQAVINSSLQLIDKSKITLKDLYKLNLNKTVLNLLTSDYVKAEIERYGQSCYLCYSFRNKDNFIGVTEKEIRFFGRKETIFLYSSIGRGKMDLLILFLYLNNTRNYNHLVKNFIVHLPDEYDYSETLQKHENELDFESVTSYYNSNSGNTVYILKKDLTL